MNICFAVNDAYADKLAVTMLSILADNRQEPIHFYCLTTDFTEESKKKINALHKAYGNWDIVYLCPDKALFAPFKLTSDYISIETYYRYAIADMLADEDKCLYLDADIAVNGQLKPLYDTELGDNYCAGARDLYVERIGHNEKIGLAADDLYINAGVLLLNLALMRRDNISACLFENTVRLQDKIRFQDQDILNITLKGRIKEIDSIYNFASANTRREKSKIKNAVIIHYTGAVKPWNKGCKNKLKKIWHTYNSAFNSILNRKIKIGLLIDEFFGGGGTAFGGYGFLARRYIAKYIPDDNIEIDVLIGKGKKQFFARKCHVDDVDLYWLPRNRFMARRWLKKQNYDLYLSIELTNDWVLRNEPDDKKKLVLWIQDPRPKYEWDEINTVKLFPEKCYYNQKIYDLVHDRYEQGRVRFISQGYFLNPKAKDLYRLEDNTPIQYLPNPIETDNIFDIKTYPKKNRIIFLGRIESVKRGWLFCEIAKLLPEYEFYVLGQSFREKDKNSAIMAKYQNIPNLHFAGHVDGAEKEKFLKDAKILINTSIHEALPISFLEALSYGTLLVSNRNPEDLTAKFGIHVGDVSGDGFDKVDLYAKAVKEIMSDDEKRIQTAVKAIDYIRKTHNVERFVRDIKDVIYEEIIQGRRT